MKILAVDIGGTAIKIVELDETGMIQSTKEIPSDAKRGGPYVINKVMEIIDGYTNYCGIGISTAGQVDVVHGSIVYANENIPNYTGMQIKKIIEEKTGVPVYVDNDVNAAALGEAHYGAGKLFDDFLCLTYGTGIGGAIVIDKKIYRGGVGVAGEFGHIITHPEGKLCGCKMRGCYEQYASVTALIRESEKINPHYSSGKILFEKMKEDKAIEHLLSQWIDEVVVGLLSLVNIFNPPCIILGGGIMEQEFVVNEVRLRMQRHMMPSFSQVHITKAALGNKAGALGVGAMVINQYFKKNIK